MALDPGSHGPDGVLGVSKIVKTYVKTHEFGIPKMDLPRNSATWGARDPLLLLSPFGPYGVLWAFEKLQKISPLGRHPNPQAHTQLPRQTPNSQA